MHKSLPEILVCPSCKSNLEVICFENGETDIGQLLLKPEGQEVISGLLTCLCGTMFPVIEGVPRFLEGGVTRFPSFVEKFRQQIERSAKKQVMQADSVGTAKDDDYENIRKSFSQEWGIFDYEGDKTWGWTLDERKEVVLGELRMKPEEMAGKLLLDAGCGNGTLSAALSDLGPDVVGVDLNDGLGLAYRNRAKYGKNGKEKVQFIQGNIVFPPLKEGRFDLVYSSGVIHHTPSSKKTFDTLVRMTKRGGRLYIWVYGRRALPVRIFFWCGESLKRWLSLGGVLRVCRLIAPFYKMAAATLNMLGIMKFRSRTTREVTLDLFDAFAPKFNHWHTQAEVRSWFEEHGFKNITLSSCVRQGFGMFGDKG